MQSAVANGKLEGQSVHGGLYSSSTSASAMWNADECSSASSAAAADCRAIVPMLSGTSLIDLFAAVTPARITNAITSCVLPALREFEAL